MEVFSKSVTLRLMLIKTIQSKMHNFILLNHVTQGGILIFLNFRGNLYLWSSATALKRLLPNMSVGEDISASSENIKLA